MLGSSVQKEDVTEKVLFVVFGFMPFLVQHYSLYFVFWSDMFVTKKNLLDKETN